MPKIIDIDITAGHPSEDTENTAITSNESSALSLSGLGKPNSGFIKPSGPTGKSPSATVPVVSSNNDGEFECDYDGNVSILYKLLESSDWEKAAARTETHPNEAKTWIIRRNKEQEVVWKLLPLHAAVLFFCPVSVTRALLEMYPKAASRSDDRGMLPLHLAFRQKEKDEALLEMLLVHYPKGVHVQDQRGRVPLEYCKETLFSAKLMRLYADASVAGAKSPTVVGPGAATVAHAADGKEKEKYEEKIASILSLHEDRIQLIIAQNNVELDVLRKENEKTKARLEEEYNAKVEGSRNEEELSMLKRKNEEIKSELEMVRVLLKGTKVYNEELSGTVKEIIKDQETLQVMLAEQQEELESAQAMRRQLLMSLVEQEEEDQVTVERNGKEMVKLSEEINDRIEKVLARAPPPAEQAAEPVKENGTTNVAKEQQQQPHHHDDISAITDTSCFA